MSVIRDLYEAMQFWKQDEPLPLDLAAKLIEAGYDVERLERHYRP